MTLHEFLHVLTSEYFYLSIQLHAFFGIFELDAYHNMNPNHSLKKIIKIVICVRVIGLVFNDLSLLSIRVYFYLLINPTNGNSVLLSFVST